MGATVSATPTLPTAWLLKASAADVIQRKRTSCVPNGNAAQRSMIAGAALVFPGPDTGPTLPPFAFVMRWTVLQVVLRPTGNAEL